jgi:hypothetical protein
MPWRGAERPGEFPSLGYAVAELIESKCAIPDGDHAGEPYLLTDEMLRFLLWHYRINPDASYDATNRAWRNSFVYDRGSQLIRPQKWGKGPFISAMVCAEADSEGPVRFDGWDADGEPVGKPWPTPWIQITAISEDQTDNVYRALLPMIERGSISADIPDTGETRINLPGGGRIEPVTSASKSRQGQRITFAPEDEVQSWTEHNGGRKLADTQRRNLAGMGGRWVETGNAWDPAEESVAQQTSELKEPGVFFDDVEPGEGSIRNKVERRRMLKKVYADSWWVDLDRIESEIAALIDRDPAQAERYFLNRKRASEDSAFSPEQWARMAEIRDTSSGSLITIGVDGARFADSLAIVATDVLTGYEWPLGIWERPQNAPGDYEHPMDEVDAAMVEAFDRFDVWRAYVDPQYIEGLVDKWQGRWGEKRVIKWYTNRPSQIAWAVRNFSTAVASGDFAHDGDGVLATHIANAKKRKMRVYDDQHRQMHTLSKDRSDSPRKMDGAMAAVLSWEARGDAIAAGATQSKPERSRDWVMW